MRSWRVGLILALLAACSGEMSPNSAKKICVSSSVNVSTSSSGDVSNGCTRVSSMHEAFKSILSGAEEVLLESGEHVLAERLQLGNGSVVFRGMEGSSVVPHSSEAGIAIRNTSNVTFDNVHFVGNVSGILVEVDSSSDVVFRNVEFTELGENSVGLYIENSIEVKILNCSFSGQSSPVSIANNRSGLNVTFTNFNDRCRCINKSQECLSDCSQSSLDRSFTNGSSGYDVTILGCSFTNFSQIQPSLPEVWNSRLRDLASIPANVLFQGAATQNLSVLFSNGWFEEIESYTTTTFHQTFLDGASGNTVVVSNTTFTQCTAKVGAGMYVAFADKAENNVVRLEDNRFVNLNVTIEGGALFGIFIDASRNFIQVERCLFHLLRSYMELGVGSAVMLYCNRPSAVVAVQRYNEPYQVNISNSNFTNNQGSFGTIFLRSIAVELRGTNVYSNNNMGGAIQLYQSIMKVYGYQKFENNSGFLGGAISLNDRSVVSLSSDNLKRVELTSNNATFDGGAIYTDPSSGESFVNWVNHKIGLSGILGGLEDVCIFTGSDASLSKDELKRLTNSIKFLTDEEEIPPLNATVKATIVLKNNNAGANGRDLAGTNLYTCSQFFTSCQVLDSILTINSSSVPEPLSKERCIKLNDTLFKKPVRSKVSTDVEWLFFKSASCTCLKLYPNESDYYWKFYDNCLAENIISIAGNQLKGYESLRDRLGINFPVPPYQMFSVPWSESWASQFLRHSDNKSIYDLLNLSKIVLTPSPGENFDLQIAGYNQFLDQVNASIGYLTLQNPDDPDTIPNVLMRQGHKLYSRFEPIIIRLNKALGDFSLLGRPNTAGKLWIRTNSLFPDVTQTMSIDYRLAPCHLGYSYTSINEIDAKKIIEDAITGIATGTEAEKNLSCNCMKEVSAIHSCGSDNKDVNIVKRMWAGNANDPEGTHIRNVTGVKVTSGNLSSLMGGAKEFAWGQCTGSVCDTSIEESMWKLSTTNPCQPNRFGNLCGKCKPNHTVTAFNTKCVDCNGWKGSAGVFFTFLILLGMTAFLVMLAMLTDIGTSTTFDTLLFFFQITPLIPSPSSEMADKLSSYPFPSIDISDICFTSQFSSSAYLGFQFVFPSLLLCSALLLIIFSRHGVCLKIVNLPRSLKALVFTVILSYNLFVTAALQPLQANRIYNYTDMKGDVVTLLDGTLPFSSPQNVALLPFSIITIVAVIFLPIAAAVYQNRPKIKPISDIYTYFYRQPRCWWIAVNLGRRFVITVLATGLAVVSGPNQNIYRQNCLMFVILALAVVHSVAKPFRSTFANHFETIVLLNMSLFAILTIPPNEKVSIVMFYIIATWPYAVGVIIFIYKHRMQIKRMCLSCHWKVSGKCEDQPAHHSRNRADSEMKLAESFDLVDDTD